MFALQVALKNYIENKSREKLSDNQILHKN